MSAEPASDQWVATYMQRGTERTAEFATLRGAVRCAVEGTEFGAYHVERITGPDGRVIEGTELSDARLHYALGEDDYDRRRIAKWKPLLDE
jgi:hypothetical protein